MVLERRNQVLMIPLDVAGAFDRVWHAGLLKKLIAGGMDERAIRLMKDYFKNQFIQVVAGKQKSKKHRIFSSVPQGGKMSAP